MRSITASEISEFFQDFRFASTHPRGVTDMEAAMTSHLSERFYDQERKEVYLDLIQSSLDRPCGGEQAWFLDRIASAEPRRETSSRTMPRLSLRWFALPRLPIPFLTWASS